MGRGNRRSVRMATLAAGLLVLAACQPLGGPNHTFGNDLPDGCTSLTSTAAPCPNPNVQPGVWAAIQGPLSRHRDGDPFATMCAGDTTTVSTCDPNWPTGGPPYTAASGVQNATYHPNGYTWAVDVPQGAVAEPLTVEIYDPANGGTGAPLDELLDASGGPFNTSYELFATTGRTNDVEETPALSMNGKCATGPGYQDFANGSGPSFFTEKWFTLCTFTPTQAGIYPLRVKTSDIPGVPDAGDGWNAYAVKAVSAGPTQPDVYGVADVSTWMDTPSTLGRFYLTNVGSQQAGHTLDVDLFDPGDGSGPDAFTMQVVGPPSGLGVVPTGGATVPCSYNATPSPTIGPSTPNTSTTCTVTTKLAGASTGVYDNAWLRFAVTLPTSYTCSADCWWSMVVNYGTGSSVSADRLTWTVSVH
ncbi:MAG TPA: hypothetical protein VMT43_10090 [Acidimicrobiales bacterium]|nr:hypothetical protein [Acidimicrobiales bacterium]